MPQFNKAIVKLTRNQKEKYEAFYMEKNLIKEKNQDKSIRLEKNKLEWVRLKLKSIECHQAINTQRKLY